MNRKMIGKMLGFLLLLECLFLLPPALISVWDGEREALRALFTTMTLSAGAGALLWGGVPKRGKKFLCPGGIPYRILGLDTAFRCGSAALLAVRRDPPLCGRPF